ncbi:hypothetical protein SAMN05444274_101139 [Mariniphaga anaerophila]|uniref:ATPase n=1 Tax=Mariniphaga anaerophila TaxID=1484053 RepID=A0A1M4ST26_9BACT|nr:ATPase [Mariniphaga anaerophila]SHE35404.1 hypothetical protein SAMN05444274_101139 [Mariniphaga anaerophila]
MEKRKATAVTHSTSKPIKITLNPYKDIATQEAGVYQFSFPGCRRWLEETGRQHYGEHFRLYAEDYGVIYRLLVYAIEDKAECARRNLDLRKGILLTGPIGCGKSTLMALIKYFFPPGRQYQVKSTRDIGFEFENEGYKVITRYSRNQLNPGQAVPVPAIFCFDDLGVEQPYKYFGNACNVMAEILLSRYDLFISKGILTHVTTNLSASEIEEKYGNRVRSRMREMFNLVAFDKSAKDKRV